MGILTEYYFFQLDCRAQELPKENIDALEEDAFIARKTNCTIFLGYTSNMGSSGVRDIIKFLVQHKLVRGLIA